MENQTIFYYLREMLDNGRILYGEYYLLVESAKRSVDNAVQMIRDVIEERTEVLESKSIYGDTFEPDSDISGNWLKS
jgi:hypothetical protein